MSPRRGSRKRRKRRTRGRATRMRRLVGLLGVAATAAALAIGLSSEPAEVEATRDLTRWSGSRVRVEVLNGGGVPGMARAATDRLREVGFDVVSFGNAASFDADRPSVVIDRVGHPELARAVAAGLGIDNVHSEPDPNLYVEVTVVLGGAWTPDSVPDPAEEAEDGPLWDPRTWFER